ncbi:MAG: orotate phosphoribosyltransferase [Bacteroidetes bacterium]|jgi:orotate phosphoribosyltransferase|nr:orotate phosphoribosyltransferase [Bacteroidota bacterium]
METTAKTIALSLLQINAIQLSPQKPFTWASGIRSPIYCDNRLSLAYPELRNRIKKELCASIHEINTPIDTVVGVATAGIPQAALVAAELDIPMLYVRSKPKGHGRKNLIEGQVLPDMNRAIVIEDLISTGQSSLKAVDAIRETGIEVAGVLSIFTYGLDASRDAFSKSGCPSYSLTTYDALIDVAVEGGFVDASDIELLKEWREDPKNWNK